MVFEWKASEDNLLGTDKTTLHSYGEVYESIFQKLRPILSPTLMEIGVLSGASIVNLAHEFPRSTIYAVDIDLSNVLYRDDVPSWSTVHWVQMDATVHTHPSLLAEESFDLIIDDGSHCADDILKAFDVWAKRLNNGGFYVIEDLTETVLQNIFGQLKKIATTLSMTLEIHDLRSVKGRWDDILIVGRRGDNGGV